MSNLKKSIDQASGAYKVFLAIKGDPRLQEAFTYNQKGLLYFNGKPMNEHHSSEIAVYLAKNWRVAVTNEELRAGILACSEIIKPSITFGVDSSDELLQKVKDWLSKNKPSSNNFSITTTAISMEVDPIGFENNQRLTEMKIARILRNQGLEKARVSHDGERKMRWFPAKDMV